MGMTKILFFALVFQLALSAYEIFSVYELGMANSASQAPELLGEGPTMHGGDQTANGVHFNTYKEWVTGGNEAMDLAHGRREPVTMLTIFKPEACEDSKFLMWAWVPGLDDARCGIVCFDDFVWRLGCKDFDNKITLSNGIPVTRMGVLTFALSFHSHIGVMAMTLLWKEKGRQVQEYSLLVSTLEFDTFFPETKLSYGTYKGDLYYLAFISGALDSLTFSQYVGDPNLEMVEMKCLNCLSSNTLTCPSPTIKVVPNQIREYFCSCKTGSVYDSSKEQCVDIIYNCTVPCAFGCVDIETPNCVVQCPKPFVEQENMGDYSMCACADGEISGQSGSWCTKPKCPRCKFYKIVLPIILVCAVLLTAAIIILVKRKSIKNSSCFKSIKNFLCCSKTDPAPNSDSAPAADPDPDPDPVSVPVPVPDPVPASVDAAPTQSRSEDELILQPEGNNIDIHGGGERDNGIIITLRAASPRMSGAETEHVLRTEENKSEIQPKGSANCGVCFTNTRTPQKPMFDCRHVFCCTSHHENEYKSAKCPTCGLSNAYEY